MTTPAPQRMIAIVGRPNVGKSAIFNRILNRRVAIVHGEPGVTRDRLIREADWRGERFELVDTGGLDLMDEARADHEIRSGTHRQVEVAISDAAVILFVTDAQSGILPLDEEVARLLHRSGKPVLLAANKADNATMEGPATEFGRFGFPVHPVSALHNRGFDALLAAAVARLPPAEPPRTETALKVAVVGRPNAGKSSFINRLLGSERLIVSAVPGTTRDSIEVPFAIGSGPQARRYLLIDTAGMRHVRKVDNAVELFSVMRAEQSIARADVVVLMIDARQGPANQDKKIADMIFRYDRGAVILVNKWDLAQGVVTQTEYEKALRSAMPFLSFVPICFISAREGYNVHKCIEQIDAVAGQVSLQLGTGLLNRVLRDAFLRTQPPMVDGKRIKLYYAAQTGTRPLRIKLFVNAVRRMLPAYESYLKATLRKAFGLEGAPVVFSLACSHKLASADAAAPPQHKAGGAGKHRAVARPAERGRNKRGRRGKGRHGR